MQPGASGVVEKIQSAYSLHNVEIVDIDAFFLDEPVEGEPTRISKINTVMQLLFLLFVLSHAAFGWPDKIALTVLGAATLVTVVVSGIDYVVQWSDRARKGI